MTASIPGPAPTLLWLRRELRLHDNAALVAAIASGHPVLPVFVLDVLTPGAWAIGAASRWWLHHSLSALASDLARLGAPLILRHGATADCLAALARETGAAEIHAGQPVEPWAREVVADLRRKLEVPVHLHRTITLYSPDEIRTGGGTPYGVFTPFARACRARGRPAKPLPAPARIDAPSDLPQSDVLESWGLLPTKPDWSGGLVALWHPGETAARADLDKFAANIVVTYDETRNLPGRKGTSSLSPRLHWGEISPAQGWHAAEEHAPDTKGTESWISELLWREFSAHLLWHHPSLPEQPLRREFAAMPWKHDAQALHAWQFGRTGIPLVDAGMRQLRHIGWMHNRIRMVTASFLVKHLMMSWQDGEAWFWENLVDADLASNSAQWQWVAGCGADAAPFFRVFNPALQGGKFDADGAYVRQWVPELARLPNRHLHAPWDAPADVLAAAGVTLGGSYPRPIKDLAVGRREALAAFALLPKLGS